MAKSGFEQSRVIQISPVFQKKVASIVWATSGDLTSKSGFEVNTNTLYNEHSDIKTIESGSELESGQRSIGWVSNPITLSNAADPQQLDRYEQNVYLKLQRCSLMFFCAPWSPSFKLFSLRVSAFK